MPLRNYLLTLSVIKKRCAGRKIEWNKCRNLVEVRSGSREAVFDVMKDGKSTGQTQVFKVCSAMCAVLLVYVYTFSKQVSK